MEPQPNWKNDPRLAGMSREKLDYLTAFAEQISQMQKDQILPAFLTMQMDASKRNIRFNDQETELLVSILSSGMSPAEKKRLDALKILAKKLAARSS